MYPQNSTACVWAGFISKQYDNTALPYRYVNIFVLLASSDVLCILHTSTFQWEWKTIVLMSPPCKLDWTWLCSAAAGPELVPVHVAGLTY